MHDVIVHQTRRVDWVRELGPANYPVTRLRFMGSVVTHTGPCTGSGPLYSITRHPITLDVTILRDVHP